MGTATSSSLLISAIAPAQVVRGWKALEQIGSAIARLGKRPLLVGGQTTLSIVQPRLQAVLAAQHLQSATADYGPDCSENGLASLHEAATQHAADLIIGIGGGKALDASKVR